jgi:hypothetical protein
MIHQDDQGVTMELTKEFPNILILSAGGFGHIPIPLIKGELTLRPPRQSFNTAIGFYGSIAYTVLILFVSLILLIELSTVGADSYHSQYRARGEEAADPVSPREGQQLAGADRGDQVQPLSPRIRTYLL